MYDIQLGDSTSNTDNDELMGNPPSNVNVQLNVSTECHLE